MSDYIVHTDNGDEYLVHYGVLGMKWGEHLFRRNDPSVSDSNKINKRYKKNQKRIEKRAKKVARYKEIGLERLKNREGVANYNVDKYASKGGWHNTTSSADYNKKVREIKNVANEIRNDEDRLVLFGERTRRRIIGAHTGMTAVGAAGLVTAGAAIAASSAPVTFAALVATGAVEAGLNYYRESLKY